MSPRSVPELLDLIESGTKVKYLHFWGHERQADGSVGAGCLSQWWPSPFTVDGRVFNTAEHWMMWSKATLFADLAAAQRILEVRHPAQAKQLGREVAGFDEAVWTAERESIVVAGSVAKFSQHHDLKAYLLGTGDRILVEASPLDSIWGIGLAADDPHADDPAQWLGLNLLGFALMTAREAIRES